MGNLFRRRFIPVLAVALSLVPALLLMAFIIPPMTAALSGWLSENSGPAWRLEYLEIAPSGNSTFSFYNNKLALSFKKSDRVILCTATAAFDRGKLLVYSRPENGPETRLPVSFEPRAGLAGARPSQVFRFAVSQGVSYSFQQDIREDAKPAEEEAGGGATLDSVIKKLIALSKNDEAGYDLFAFRLSGAGGPKRGALVRFTASGKPGSLSGSNPFLEFPAKYPFLLPESARAGERAETLQLTGPGYKPQAIKIPGRFHIPLDFISEPFAGFVLARKSESGAYSAVNESAARVRVARNLAASSARPTSFFYPVFSDPQGVYGFHAPFTWVDYFSGAGDRSPWGQATAPVEFLSAGESGLTFHPEKDALFVAGLGFTLREAVFAPLAGFITSAFAMLFTGFCAAFCLVYLFFPFFTVRFSKGNTASSIYSLTASGLTVFMVTGLTFLGLFQLLYLNLDSAAYPELNKVHFFLDCSQGVFRITALSMALFLFMAVLKYFRPSRNFLFGWFFDEARHARKLFFATLISFALSVGVFAVKPGRSIILLCSSTLLLLFPLAFTSYLTYFRLRVKRRLSLGGVAVFSGLIPLVGFAVPLALYDEFGPILIYSLFLFLAWPAVGFFTDKNRLLPLQDEQRGRFTRAVQVFFVAACTLVAPIAWFVVEYPPLAALLFMPIAFALVNRTLSKFGWTFSPNMAQTLFIIWLGIGATTSLLCFYQKDFELPGMDMFYSRMDKMNVPALRDDADIPHSLIYEPGTRLGSLARRIHTDFAMSLTRSLYKDVFTAVSGTLLAGSLLFAYLAVLFLSLWQMQAYTLHQSIKRLNEPLFRFVCFAFLGVFGLYSFLSTGCYLPLTGVPFPLVSDGDSYRFFTLTLLWISLLSPWQERTY
ncbi:MAG: hypothetical protein HZB23_11215 [Deltaproteobacteria bacterium]|nr:hypothetical protein [Deltaproteobacteria bacterium]